MQAFAFSNTRLLESKPLRTGGENGWHVLAVEDLVRRCQTGDQLALEELVRRYRRSIYSLAYRLTNNHADVEDVAAESLLSICRGIGTFRTSMALSAWIHRIVKNVWFDMQRRAVRQKTVALNGLSDGVVDSLLFKNGCPAPITPQTRVENEERTKIIQKAITSLPGCQRTIILLYYCESKTYEEIAAMLDIPVGTVKSRLSRARISLRNRLAPQRKVLWTD